MISIDWAQPGSADKTVIGTFVIADDLKMYIRDMFGVDDDAVKEIIHRWLRWLVG